MFSAYNLNESYLYEGNPIFFIFFFFSRLVWEYGAVLMWCCRNGWTRCSLTTSESRKHQNIPQWGKLHKPETNCWWGNLLRLKSYQVFREHEYECTYFIMDILSFTTLLRPNVLKTSKQQRPVMKENIPCKQSRMLKTCL